MLKNQVRAKFENFFLALYDSLKFLYLYIRERRKYNYYFPYTPLHKGEVVNILANGPSLNAELNDLLKDKTGLENSLVVNYFVFSDQFLIIKPRYYCLADPGFNNVNQLKGKTKDTYLKMNELVNWPMTLFVWKDAVKMVSKIINNPYIKIVGLSTLRFKGFENRRYKYFKKGIAVPSYVNVTIMALYALLNLGYSKIYLYGVDHSFLKGISVNDLNRLCLVDQHFYGTNKFELPPRPNGDIWNVKDFVYDKYLTFVEHEIMRGYADYLGAQIINCTKDSWIDAYVRKAQLEKQPE